VTICFSVNVIFKELIHYLLRFHPHYDSAKLYYSFNVIFNDLNLSLNVSIYKQPIRTVMSVESASIWY